MIGIRFFELFKYEDIKVKKYIVAFFSMTMILLSMNNNAINAAFDEPQGIDQMSIDKLSGQMREYLNNHDFESIIQALPDNLAFDIYNETKEFKWIGTKVDSLIRLGRKNEACDFMEKLVLQPMDEKTLAGMFFYKYFTDCLNDNYGNATVSITKVIEMNEKLTDLSKTGESAFIFYQMRADVYAARRMHKEAEDDLAKMQELRRQYPSIFLSGTPGEYMLRKYLEDPEGKSFHRVEMPLAKADPTKGSFTVNWWCCGLSEEDKDEYYRLFVEPLLQTGER